jgi:hypothetical protein
MNDKEQRWVKKTVRIRTALLLILLSVVVYYAWFFSYYYVDLTTNYNWHRVADIAVQTNDPTECSKIRSFKIIDAINDAGSYPLHIAYCYTDVAEQLQDYNICEKYLKDYEKDECLAAVAEKKNDINGCHSITDDADRGSCYGYFTKKGADKSVCESFEEYETYGKEYCYLGVMLHSPDKTICETKFENYPDGSSNVRKDECYKRLTFKTTNPSYCITLPKKYHDSCYHNVAENTENISTCALITDTLDQGICETSIKNRSR